MNAWIQTQLTFDPTPHVYKWDGVVKRSTTQILQSVAVERNGEFVPLLDTRWMQNEAAALFGTSFHKAAALLMQKKIIKTPDEMQPWIKQWHRWRKDHFYLQVLTDSNGVPLIEYPFYSVKYDYCGTPDVVMGKFNDKGKLLQVYIIDYKTSQAEETYWNWQTAAYKQGIEELFRFSVPYVRMAVRFTADTFRPLTRNESDFHVDWMPFLSCLTLLKT